MYAQGGTPCVAAYSSTRALSSAYSGPLYEVRRASDGAVKKVTTLSASRYADAASQDSFCEGTSCKITVIYDQSGNGNDLTPAPAGDQGAANNPADAAALPVTISGHRAYGIYMPPGVAYRRSSTVTAGTARGQDPESMYEVASGTNVNSACCSDFGNVETESKDTGAGHMDTLNVSTLGAVGATGHGPWVQADLENGVFQGHTPVWTQNRGNSSKFVTATLKNNGTDTFALKGGDSQQGTLTTWYDGDLPAGTDGAGNSWSPMHLEGSVGLGAGGDNSNRGTQSFFEGVMTAGYATDAVENSVQADIVAQGYEAASTGGGPGRTITAAGGQCVDVAGDDVGGDGARVQLWGCQRLAADQHWISSGYGDHTIGTLGRCMTAVDGPESDESQIVLNECDGSTNQEWRAQSDSTIINPASGLCIDTHGTASSDGTGMVLAACDASPTQKFRVTVPILHPVQGQKAKCVDVAGDDVDTNGGSVQLWDCQNLVTGAPGGRSESADQQWSYDSGTETLRTLGRCLDVANNSTLQGTEVGLWSCNGNGGQKWVPRSDGSVLNPQSGYCLDSPNGTTTNGTVLRIWECNGADAQKFTMN